MMKKMLAGIILLSILFAGAIINSIYLDNMLSNVKIKIENINSRSEDEHKAELKSALDEWESMGLYVSIITSDSKYTRITEAFYEAISEPLNPVKKEKLIYEINSLIDSEKIRIASVF